MAPGQANIREKIVAASNSITRRCRFKAGDAVAHWCRLRMLLPNLTPKTENPGFGEA
jgi:hypothetical protein